MSTIGGFEVRDPAVIRDAILRVIKNGLIARGVVDPNVTFGSDYYIIAQALSNELAVVEANAVISADNLMPDTATGDALDRWLAIVGLSKRPATGAIGNITLSSTQPSPVTTGSLLQDQAGLTFQVLVGGTFNDGDSIQVQGVSTGIATNHINGDVLTWVSPPPFSNPTATVGLTGGTDGLIDGVDEEDEETARARLLSRLANPPAAGNWEHLAEISEASSPVVQKAFPYPAVQGPSSCQIAVAGFSTAFLDIPGPSALRAIDATILANTVAPYIRGLVPESVDLLITTTNDVATDVSFGLALPSAPTASPAGPGGGWLDGSPWPAISGLTYTKAIVTGVTSTIVFTVDAPTPPIAGVSRIAFLRSSNWKLYSSQVLSYTGSGPYTVTVDTPMTGIAVGDFIFPQSVRQTDYVTAVLQAFAKMGPGEKTSNVGILQRGFRHPAPQQAWPASLGAIQLRALEDVGEEVLTADYYFRSVTTPAVPGAVTDPPNILVPRHVGFYPL